MKKRFLILLIAVAPIILMAQEPRSREHRDSDADADASARERAGKGRESGFDLTQTELELFERGEGAQLSVAGAARGESFRWVSDDATIASVDEKGFVAPRGVGFTRVRAVAADGRKTNICAITVSKPSYWGSLNGTDHLVVQNEWAYFANPADGNRLYKVHVTGRTLTRISDDMPECLNVAERWIYYYNTNPATKPGIYKISVDGEQRTLLNDKDHILYLRVNRNGWAFYLNEKGEVFSLRTHKPNEPVQKLFDEKPIYSVAVNDFYIFYNRHWEDIPQPNGAGGIFSFNLKSKKKTGHLSVNINTSPVILDQNRDNTAYYCSYGNHAVNVRKGPLSGIFHDSPSTGWFAVISLDEGADSFLTAQNRSGSAGSMPEMKSLISKIKLQSGDSIQWVIDGWIYYARDAELRRMQVDGKADQNVTAPPAKVNAWHFGGDYLFYWTVDNRLFRTLKDGRNTEEIVVKQ